MALLKKTAFILGDQTTRKTLESTYVDANTSAGIDVRNAIQTFLEVEYTMGAGETGNSIEVRIRYADMVNKQRLNVPSSTHWYQPTTETINGGSIILSLAERTFTAVSAAATYDRFEIAIPQGHDFIEVAIKETGVATNKGSASVKLVTVEQEL